MANEPTQSLPDQGTGRYAVGRVECPKCGAPAGYPCNSASPGIFLAEDHHERLVAERDRLRAEVAALREALANFAVHDEACRFDFPAGWDTETCRVCELLAVALDETQAPAEPDDDDLDPSLFEPTVGYCSKCGEARTDVYTCRDGGSTVPRTQDTPEEGTDA